MIAVWIILGLFLLILLWLMLAPVTITIDTREEIYQFRMFGIIRARLVYEDGEVIIKSKIFELIRYNIRPGASSSGKKSPKDKEQKSEKRKKGRGLRSFPVRTVLKVARDFFKAIKIKKLEVEFDLDDEALNAQLYPLCIFLSNDRFSFSVNWDSYYRLLLLLQFRIISFVNMGMKFVWRMYIKPRFRLNFQTD
jgi:hypothetical protein